MVRKSALTIITVLALAFGAAVSLGAEDVRVDRDELASIGDQSIKFINYVGPYEFINTLDQIRGIGRSLGSEIVPEEPGGAAVGGKYRVIHVISPDIEEGLDADIFILEADAKVDHINNLRTIIAGYLETAYGFSGRDAYLVAEFVTYYNAVFRGDMDMASERYKPPVVDELDPAKLGLDTHFSNWPGQTQMLIPLRRAAGAAAPKVDTGAITEDEVIEEMRGEADMGLESRKDMVELREEEIDEEQAALDERREEVEQKAEAVEKELAELDEKEEAGGELSAAEEERREELEEEKAAVEEEKTAVEEAQEELDERTEEVLEMRDDIAEDENERMRDDGGAGDTFTSAEMITPVWFLMVDDEGDGIPFGRVVMYDLESGRRLATSEVTAVRGRSMAILPDSLLVIAGKEGGSSRVRLMLLDSDTLETDREGTDDVFPGSLMTVKGSDIYLVTAVDGEWRLGRFDTNLGRAAVSEVAVNPWTSISFDGSSLFVQSDRGEILKLSASTLEEEARLE